MESQVGLYNIYRIPFALLFLEDIAVKMIFLLKKILVIQLLLLVHYVCIAQKTTGAHGMKEIDKNHTKGSQTPPKRPPQPSRPTTGNTPENSQGTENTGIAHNPPKPSHEQHASTPKTPTQGNLRAQETQNPPQHPRPADNNQNTNTNKQRTGGKPTSKNTGKTQKTGNTPNSNPQTTANKASAMQGIISLLAFMIPVFLV
ncbi:hypothetical protein Zmor_022107 [Zophobas morio]|jgi:hypothetical protein|uniref:Uncharacterized protein n=1 Tax=Zophobas morio TaxID=2755281 RepID=A0AA38HL48_9CUCU|nr:hypothetical protein Zmor_022107 [Zophobas morio]